MAIMFPVRAPISTYTQQYSMPNIPLDALWLPKIPKNETKIDGGKFLMAAFIEWRRTLT